MAVTILAIAIILTILIIYAKSRSSGDSKTDARSSQPRQEYYTIALVDDFGRGAHIAEQFRGASALCLFDTPEGAVEYWNGGYQQMVQNSVNQLGAAKQYQPDVRIVDYDKVRGLCLNEGKKYILLNPTRNSAEVFNAKRFFEVEEF